MSCQSPVAVAQLAEHVDASLHRRHLSRLSDAALVSVMVPAPEVLDAPQRTVWAALDESSLPTSVTLGAFRRLARLACNWVVRAAARHADAPPAVDQLVVRPDRLTTDWVRRYVAPDGVAGLGEAGRALLTDEIAQRVAPGVGAEELLRSGTGSSRCRLRPTSSHGAHWRTRRSAARST